MRRLVWAYLPCGVARLSVCTDVRSTANPRGCCGSLKLRLGLSDVPLPIFLLEDTRLAIVDASFLFGIIKIGICGGVKLPPQC